MNTLAKAESIKFEGKELIVRLTNGNFISTPVDKYPRLASATDAQRNNYRFIGKGVGIHWEDLDEDLSIAGMLKEG